MSSRFAQNLPTVQRIAAEDGGMCNFIHRLVQEEDKTTKEPAKYIQAADVDPGQAIDSRRQSELPMPCRRLKMVVFEVQWSPARYIP